MIRPGKYLITGIAGTGKTTTIHELRGRGFTAFSDEEEGLGRIEDRATGLPPNLYKRKQRTNFSRYAWNLVPSELGRILTSDTTVFIGASTHNQYQLQHYFDALFVLIIDPETLQERIIARAQSGGVEGGHIYGQRRTELERIMSLHDEREQQALEHGAIPINSVQPTQQVADDILYYITT